MGCRGEGRHAISPRSYRTPRYRTVLVPVHNMWVMGRDDGGRGSVTASDGHVTAQESTAGQSKASQQGNEGRSKGTARNCRKRFGRATRLRTAERLHLCIPQISISQTTPLPLAFPDSTSSGLTRQHHSRQVRSHSVQGIAAARLVTCSTVSMHLLACPSRRRPSSHYASRFPLPKQMKRS